MEKIKCHAGHIEDHFEILPTISWLFEQVVYTILLACKATSLSYGSNRRTQFPHGAETVMLQSIWCLLKVSLFVCNEIGEEWA